MRDTTADYIESLNHDMVRVDAMHAMAVTNANTFGGWDTYCARLKQVGLQRDALDVERRRVVKVCNPSHIPDPPRMPPATEAQFDSIFFPNGR